MRATPPRSGSDQLARILVAIIGVTFGASLLLIITVVIVTRLSPTPGAPSLQTQARPTDTLVPPTAIPTRPPNTRVPPTATPTPFTAPAPKIGETGWIYAELASGGTAKQVPISGSPSDSIAYRKSVIANDKVGVQELFSSLHLVPVAVGTRVLVIDSFEGQADLLEVRFIDGPWATTTGWLDSSWVVSRLPLGFVVPVPPPVPTIVP